jgi:hypothetical protein
VKVGLVMWLMRFLSLAVSKARTTWCIDAYLIASVPKSLCNDSCWRLLLRIQTDPRAVQVTHELTVKSKDPMELEVNS